MQKILIHYHYHMTSSTQSSFEFLGILIGFHVSFRFLGYILGTYVMDSGRRVTQVQM